MQINADELGADMTTTAAAMERQLLGDIDRIDRNRRAVRRWLGFVLLTLFVLVLVGGATRLTGSGLSITEWKPIHGVIPPLNDVEWQEEFELYKRIPQYSADEQRHDGRELQVDLLVGMGAPAARPFHRYRLRAAARLLLGDRTDRTAVALAARRRAGARRLPGLHRLVDGFLGAGGTGLGQPVPARRPSRHRLSDLRRLRLDHARTVAAPRRPGADGRSRRWRRSIASMTLFQIYLGALVAGLHAGWSYNTWPLMDGAIVPGGPVRPAAWWLNLFENPKTVQFVHRIGAYVLVALALVHMIASLRAAPDTTHARRAVVAVRARRLQAVIGILTLVWQVPLGWALAHQGGALVVLGFAVAHWRGFVGEYPKEARIEVGA